MQVNPEVTVISAFGRSNWLAAELAEHNINVMLVDVTESLGRWAPEDWEGPFGFLQQDELLNSQMHRLTEDDHRDEVKDGLTFWLPEGPIDMRGLLVPHWLESMPAVYLAKRYIQNYATLTSQEIEDQQEDLLLKGFKQNWLAQLSHQLASPVYRPNALAFESGRPLPIFAQLAVRRVTRKGLQNSLEWCRSKGVEILPSVRLADVVLDGKSCAGVQVTGEVSRVIVGENVVWGLSSAETKMLSPHAAEVLFPQGELNPEWVWMRWRLRGSWAQFQEAVPTHLVMVENLSLPWTHTNLLVVQRAVVEDLTDVWARIPAHHRFQRGYVEQIGQQMCQILSRRCPGYKPEVQDWPQEYHYDFAELGPALFPVFDSESHRKWTALKLKNLHYESAEWVDNLDWNGRFARQNEIMKILVKWKQAKMAKLAKQKGTVDDSAIHPS